MFEYCVCSLHHNCVRLSDNAKIWEDRLRQFLDQSEEEKKEASNPLQEVWKMCQQLGLDSGSYFKQVCIVGCVRAGVTRLDKNLVSPFSLVHELFPDSMHAFIWLSLTMFCRRTTWTFCAAPESLEGKLWLLNKVVFKLFQRSVNA